MMNSKLPTMPIRISAEAHTRLRLLKARYGASSYSEVIMRLTQAADPDIDRTVARFAEFERRVEEERRQLAGDAGDTV